MPPILTILVGLLLPLLIAVGPAVAGERTALPRTIEPYDVEGVLVAELDRGLDGGQALTPAAWRDVEELYLAHLDRVEREVEPRQRELLEAMPTQGWMNWPTLKPAPVRAIRDAASDLVVALDRAFFDGLAARWETTAPELAPVARRAAIRWELEQRPATNALVFRRIVDVEPLVRAAMDLAPITADERRAIDELLRAEAAARLARARERIAAWRRAESALEDAIATEGLTVESLHGGDNPNIARVFDLWTPISAPYVALVEREIAATRALAEAIALRLPTSSAETLRGWLLARETDVELADTADSPLAYARFLDAEPAGTTPEERQRIQQAVDAWRRRDAAIVRRIAAAGAKVSMVAHWPLGGSGWWADAVHAGAELAAREELERERSEAKVAVWNEIRAVLGGADGPRTTELWDRFSAATKRELAVERRRRPTPQWSPPRTPTLFSSANADRLWLDEGVINAPDFDRLMQFVVGTDEATNLDLLATARTLRDDADARYRERLAEIPEYAPGLLTWTMDGSGYVHRASYASTLAAQTIPARHDLRRLEESMFDALAALTNDPDVHARLRLARALRAIDRERVAWRALDRDSLDERDLANPGGIAVALLAGRRADSIVPVAAALEALATTSRARSDAVEEKTLAWLALSDALMWARKDPDGPRERQLAEARRAAKAADLPHRAPCAAAADAVIDAIRAAAPDERDAIDELWDSMAYRAVLSGVPPARVALRAAPCDVSAITARFHERDAALRSALRTRANSALQAAVQGVDPELERLGQRRRAVSELAECAVRIECEPSASATR
ncbi:MAG: hypothetical protein JNM94_09860 [Phycisphaerae bacterium]|nr:hypothetical protein [Phycisphaerae bacterium]